MATTVSFRPTSDDERIVKAAMHTSDMSRSLLRLLERQVWLTRARADAERLADEDLTNETDAW